MAGTVINLDWTEQASGVTPLYDQSHQNGDRDTPVTPPSGDRFSTDAETTADYYVSSTGNDGNAGTSEGAAFATIVHAWSVATAGQEVMVVDEITEDIENSDLFAYPGTAENQKVLKGKNVNTVINGALQYTDYVTPTDTFAAIKNILFKQGATQTCGTGGMKHITLFRVMFTGGWLTGNHSRFACGSNQVIEQCGFYGPGGRYNFICFQQTNVTLRHCIARVDAGWSDASQPDGNIQIYSSTNVNVIQCVDFDSEDRGISYEYLGAFPTTTNEGPNTNIRHINCYTADSLGNGYNGEGDGDIDLSIEGCVSVRSAFSAVIDGGKTGATGTITVDGGVFANGLSHGIADYGTFTFALTNTPSIFGQSGEALKNTSGTYSSTPIDIPNNKVIGDLMAAYGSSGEETPQGEDLFTASNEFLSSDVQTMFKTPFETVRLWSSSNLGAIIGVTP